VYLCDRCRSLPIITASAAIGDLTCLVREETGISEEFEVEGEDECSEKDETREEEDVGDVVWSIAAV